MSDTGKTGDGRCGRYAPSPTGRLHLGNLRTALLSWLHARLNRSRFIIRMDDLDLARNRDGAADRIIDDLRWLGMEWDEGPDIGGPHKSYCQSSRTLHYQQAFDRLRNLGLLYPCYCSRKDIAQALSAPHACDKSNVYPGTCRPEQPASRIDTGSPETAWRFRVSDADIGFDDHIFGSRRQRLVRDVGDFVVKRRDGLFAYQLATVVDDACMGVTDVVRGSDLLDSTPRQIALFESLGFNPPEFWHVPLMNDDRGERLSKRDGSDSLERIQSEGGRAETVVGMLAASCGLVSAGCVLSAQELLQTLSPGEFQQRLLVLAQNGQSLNA